MLRRGRQLQGVRRRRGAVEDVARLAETVGDGGWGGRDGGGGVELGGGAAGSGRAVGAGRGGGGWRACAMGTLGMCLKSFKHFGVKNASGEDLWFKKKEVWAKKGGGGVLVKNAFCRQKVKPGLSSRELPSMPPIMKLETGSC